MYSIKYGKTFRHYEKGWRYCTKEAANLVKHCWYHRSGLYAVCFGVGLVISCFCPVGLVLFLAAVIIVALGIALVKKH